MGCCGSIFRKARTSASTAQMIWLPWQRLSTAGRARPSDGERLPRFSTQRCSQIKVALRRPIEDKQFTSVAFTGLLQEQAIAISMDGRCAWRDNVFVERLWRSVKYEEVYLPGL